MASPPTADADRPYLRRPTAWLTLIIVFSLSFAGTAVALGGINPLPMERLSLWSSSGPTETDLVIDSYQTLPKGLNRVDVSLTVRNTGAEVAVGVVTVQLLDANGDVLAERTAETTSLALEQTHRMSLSMTGDGLVSQYSQTLVTIQQP